MRAGAATPITVSRGQALIFYHGSDPEAMEAAILPGDLVSRPSGVCIEFLGREDPAPRESTIAFALDALHARLAAQGLPYDRPKS